MKLPDINGLLSQLNDTVFSSASLEGVLIIVIIIALIIWLYGKVKRLVCLIIGVLFIFEVGHLVAYSSLGNWVPELRTLFKYDVFTAVAQLFVGTPICRGILYVQAFLSAGISRCAYLITELYGKFRGMVG